MTHRVCPICGHKPASREDDVWCMNEDCAWNGIYFGKNRWNAPRPVEDSLVHEIETLTANLKDAIAQIAQAKEECNTLRTELTMEQGALAVERELSKTFVRERNEARKELEAPHLNTFRTVGDLMNEIRELKEKLQYGTINITIRNIDSGS